MPMSVHYHFNNNTFFMVLRDLLMMEFGLVIRKLFKKFVPLKMRL